MVGEVVKKDGQGSPGILFQAGSLAARQGAATEHVSWSQSRQKHSPAQISDSPQKVPDLTQKHQNTLLQRH